MFLSSLVGGHKHDILEEMGPRSSRSRSFPADPDRHMPVSPQSSLDSDEDNALRKMNSIIENANPGMKGTLNNKHEHITAGYPLWMSVFSVYFSFKAECYTESAPIQVMSNSNMHVCNQLLHNNIQA